MKKLILTLIISTFANFNYVSAQTITMPSGLTADTSSFVLLSSSGTTPSISGFSGTLLVTAVASAGNVKITTQTDLLQAAGYCGHNADSSSDITGCDDAGRTEIGFRGTQADINTGLATLSFKGDGSTGSPTVTLSVTAAGTNYNSANGHYYKVVRNNGISWTDAKTAAEASSFNGLTGYLASITSLAENNFVKSKTAANAWLGGTDSAVEGCWKWTGGTGAPDAGKIFTSGNSGSGAVSGCAVDSGYAVVENSGANAAARQVGTFGWANGEPNNAGTEHGLHMYGDPSHASYGDWNDFSLTKTSVNFYVIEYGGTTGETATTQGLTTLTISSLEASGSTHQAFNDKQLSGIVEAQTESIKRHMYNSTNSIMDRMEQFRRTGENKSLQLNDFRLVLTEQGVNNHTHAKLAKHYVQKYSKEFADKQGLDLTDNNIEKFISELPLSKYMKQEFNLKPNKWAMWSVGSLSKGGLDFSVGQLGRKNESNGFTLGADLDWSDNSLLGFALRDEVEDVTISGDGTKYKSDNSTLSFYNTWKANDENYVDAFIGFGQTKQATTRIVDITNNTKVTGELKSKQAFGAIKYNLKKNYKLINFNNYSKANFGYTMFNSYSENGDSNLKLKFDDRDLKNYSISIGSLMESKIDLKNSKFIPYLRLEITEDLTEASSLKVNYISSSSSQYSKSINKGFSSIIRAETGFDWSFKNSWNISSSIERIDKDGLGHQSNIKFSANKSF